MVAGNIVFVGTGAFAVPALKALAGAGFKLPLVVTQPDRPKGRGQKLMPTPVKLAALELGLTVFEPQNINDPVALEHIASFAPEFLVLVDYGQLLRQGILSVAKKGPVNLHPSLLPRHRGPTPVNSAILYGDEVTGVTTMLMDQGMDTGPVLMQEKFAIPKGCTAGELSEALSLLGAGLVVKTLEGITSGEVVPKPQDDAQATVTQKITKEFTVIDWSLSAVEICRKINALSPAPGARAWMGPTMIKPLKAFLGLDKGAPGEVLYAGEAGVEVGAGEGSVKITQLHPEGKKAMAASEYARGGGIKKGMRFTVENL